MIDLQEAKEELDFKVRVPARVTPLGVKTPGEQATQILQASPTAEGITPQGVTLTQKSIAVLPFTNMSADEDNEYFCDGLAEELLNALSKIKDLKVAART